MYALIHKDSERMLYVDILLNNSLCQTYVATLEGDIPLIHPTPKHFQTMKSGKYPDHLLSFQYPYLDDVDLDDYEIRVLYLSHEELANEEDS